MGSFSMAGTLNAASCADMMVGGRDDKFRMYS